MDVPSVLVISPTRLGTQTATGVVMGSLFREWPRDRIAQIHSDSFSDYDYEVCKEYYYIDREVVRKPFARKWGRVLTDLLGPDLLLRKTRVHEVLNWVRRFGPDVIYYRAVDEPVFFGRLALKLAQQLRVPLITHIMDDWPARLEAREGTFNRYVVIPRVRQQLKEVLGYSAINLSICEKMSKAFQARYGFSFIPFHNAIDIKEWAKAGREVRSVSDETFHMVYTGSIAEDMQLWSLKDIAEVTASLYGRGFKIGLDIYGAEWWVRNYSTHLGELPGVRHAGFVPRNEFRRVLMEADLLVLPVNFDRESLRYVRYSMANKSPEYMASGTPILVYGPLEAATVDYAASDGWGYVVSEQSKEKLENAILDLKSSPEKRAKLARHARKLAFRKHDAAVVRQEFRSLLGQVANGDRSIANK